MSVSAQECVASLLESESPARLLLIGDPPGDCGTEVTRIPAADALESLAKLGRFDFAVVCDLLEQVDEPTAEAVLGRLTNLHTDRFLLLADPAQSCLGREALLALALAPFERLDDGRIAWRYDIDEYNPERRWNNPDDWAHPENFQRFRW